MFPVFYINLATLYFLWFHFAAVYDMCYYLSVAITYR